MHKTTFEYQLFAFLRLKIQNEMLYCGTGRTFFQLRGEIRSNHTLYFLHHNVKGVVFVNRIFSFHFYSIDKNLYILNCLDQITHNMYNEISYSSKFVIFPEHTIHGQQTNNVRTLRPFLVKDRCFQPWHWRRIPTRETRG